MKPTSPWMDTAPARDPFPALPGDLDVDVCVIGAGITGITAALLLKEAGRTVALIDMQGVAEGVTGFTTAKVTALHGLIYDTLKSKHGKDGARVYAEANTAGLELIARWSEERGIDCDFRRRPAFTYAEDDSDLSKLEKESKSAQQAGLDVQLVDEVDLPWPVAGAVRLDDQAEFHPRKYLLALADLVDGGGSYVFENTRALGVKPGEVNEVQTDAGTVRARDVIVATHFPFLDRGLFFARVSPERSYALGVRVRGAIPFGMFRSTESPSHSVRAHPMPDGGELLVVGGESHKTGQEDPVECYEKLEAYARERFDVESVDYRWSAQDCMPADSLPYVGRVQPGSTRVWTATGFKKWGMTNGSAAALLLADLVQDRENPWAKVFDPNRLKPLASAPKLVQENVNVAKRFFGDRFSPPDAGSLDDLAPGEGGIVVVDGEKVGAYRDPQGELTLVDPVCTHLYCHLKWNQAELSWDCPCHGSRFAPDGRVVEGPAVHDLEVKVHGPAAQTAPDRAT